MNELQKVVVVCMGDVVSSQFKLLCGQILGGVRLAGRGARTPSVYRSAEVPLCKVPNPAMFS